MRGSKREGGAKERWVRGKNKGWVKGLSKWGERAKGEKIRRARDGCKNNNNNGVGDREKE